MKPLEMSGQTGSLLGVPAEKLRDPVDQPGQAGNRLKLLGLQYRIGGADTSEDIPQIAEPRQRKDGLPLSQSPELVQQATSGLNLVHLPRWFERQDVPASQLRGAVSGDALQDSVETEPTEDSGAGSLHAIHTPSENPTLPALTQALASTIPALILREWRNWQTRGP